MKKKMAILFSLLMLAAIQAPVLSLAEADTDAALMAVDESVEEDRPLAFGDEGDDVKALQTRLTELGYYTGNISGKYREGTRAAIKKVQADFAREETGAADAETLALVYSMRYRPLKYGSSGADVKRLQKQLTQLGYYKGKISGNYLNGTVDAVKAFQTAAGGYANGIADEETLAAIFDGEGLTPLTETEATPAPGDIAQVSDGDDGVDTDAEPADDEDAPITVAFTKKLAYKSTGKKVKQVQERLKELGYYEGNISGNFLGNTRNAVKAFQKQNGLENDGVIGEKTWNALFNAEDVVRPQDTPRPTPEPTPVPFHIVVDVRNQAVIVYGRDANGEYTEVVKDMICSTGTTKNPSDVGDWVLNGRKARWCTFPKWGSYAQYWTRINSSIAFHSVIYNTVSTKDLSVKSYRNLGKRASHGCIRLLVADAKWIYDNIPEGVTVTITEKLPDDPELKASLKTPELNTKTMLPVPTAQPTAEPVYIADAMPPMPLTELKRDATGEAVYWMQRKLKELGFYTGKCSGTFLGGTQNAVKAFQQANGLKVNGVATVETLELLYANVLFTPAPEPLPTPGI